MEYPVGVEMSNTYLSFEVTSAALKLVRDFMLVKEGENVVITADTSQISVWLRRLQVQHIQLVQIRLLFTIRLPEKRMKNRFARLQMQ